MVNYDGFRYYPYLHEWCTGPDSKLLDPVVITSRIGAHRTATEINGKS